jgi:hypothetical protein
MKIEDMLTKPIGDPPAQKIPITRTVNPTDKPTIVDRSTRYSSFLKAPMSLR